MAFAVNEETKEVPPMWTSDKRLYLTPDGTVSDEPVTGGTLLIGIGGEMPDAEARRLGLTKAHEQTPTVAEGDRFEEMLKPALVALADERGIDSSGTKAEIVARLREPVGEDKPEEGTGAGDAATEPPIEAPAEAPKTE